MADSLLTQEQVLDTIAIAQAIVYNEVDFEEGEGRNNHVKLSRYNSIIRPMLDDFNERHRRSPNQVLDSAILKTMSHLSQEMVVSRKGGFPFWGDGYVWPSVWAAASEPGATGQVDVRRMPQMLILVGGRVNEECEWEFGIEVGLTHGWGMKGSDLRVSKMEKNDVFYHLVGETRLGKGYDFVYYDGISGVKTKRMPTDLEFIRRNWRRGTDFKFGGPRITRWISEDKITLNIGHTVEDTAKEVYPLLHGICHLADQEVKDGDFYLDKAKRARNKKEAITCLETVLQMEPMNIEAMQKLGELLITEPLRVSEGRKYLQKVKALQQQSVD